MTVAQQKLPLGELMILSGLLTPEQLELASREQQRSGSKLTQIVVGLGFVTPELLAEFLGKQAGTKSVNLNRVTFDQTVLAKVPAEVARRCVAMPISRENGTLTVALADPFDVTAVDMLQQVSELHIDVVTAPGRDLRNCLEIYYISGDTIGQSIDKILEEKDKQKAKSL